MITYKLRPDTIPVRIDSEAKTITNVVNKPDQKILGFMSNEDYYTKYVAGAESWPLITEEEFNTAKAEVVAALSVI
jgi:hypothetical protein